MGYLILHPYAMIVYYLYERNGLELRDFSHQLAISFNVRMIPMGLPFAALGALTGLFLGLWIVSQQKKAEAERQKELLEKQLGRMKRER